MCQHRWHWTLLLIVVYNPSYNKKDMGPGRLMMSSFVLMILVKYHSHLLYSSMELGSSKGSGIERVLEVLAYENTEVESHVGE
jgi:hypothetical protein